MKKTQLRLKLYLKILIKTLGLLLYASIMSNNPSIVRKQHFMNNLIIVFGITFHQYDYFFNENEILKRKNNFFCLEIVKQIVKFTNFLDQS